MYLGRFQLGDLLPLSALGRTASGPAGLPTLPALAPTARIYGPSGFVEQVSLQIRDRYDLTAFFFRELPLGGKYATGRYQAVIQMTVGGLAQSADVAWEILPGGHYDGAVLSMKVFRTPAANFALAQCDGGRIIRRRNPRLAA